ncbi:MAG TPA: DUF805 domain-containing protein [Reyranella sp.]|nr:DUF805 domain-containing protein [Reyranella sp.]
MNFQTAVKTGLAKSLDFQGRASRSEFWWFQLFPVLLILLLVAIYRVAPSTGPAVGTASAVLYLVLYVPLLSASVRRLHDRNRSGWHILWSFAPFFGGLVLLIWFCMRGTPGENRFGPDPLPMTGAVAEVF